MLITSDLLKTDYRIIEGLFTITSLPSISIYTVFRKMVHEFIYPADK